MEITSVKLGNIDIDLNKFIEFLGGHKQLSKLFNIEIVDSDTHNVKFLSTVQNIRLMNEGDERIQRLGRPYLFTWALTKEQQKTLVDWFKANHLTVEFSEPIDSWVYATQSEESYKNQGGEL